MSDFEDIRPYSDAEVRGVLDRLIQEPELIQTIIDFRFPRWTAIFRPLLALIVRQVLKRRLKNIHTVRDLQLHLEKYILMVIANTTKGIQVSGVEHIDPTKPHLFVSNHRDIALDPSFINYALHINGIDTMRIAIGDNLLGKDWIADLMRLNKSFVVKRSVKTVRQKLMASKQLSKYMYLSITEDNANMWIAQREGRAKDGNDFTNPAVLSMLLLNKPKPMATEEYVKELRIVPVSISYEYDPCDISKANEMHQREVDGHYQKRHNEDILSIADGIQGNKGRVEVHFNEMLQVSDEFPLDNAKSVAAALEYCIIKNYVLMPTNIAAAQMVKQGLSAGDETLLKIEASEVDIRAAKEYLQNRFADQNEAVREKALMAYAAPVFNKLSVLHGNVPHADEFLEESA